MKRNLISAAALVLFSLAGSAFAQSATTSMLGVSSTPFTGSVSPGTAVPLGTVTLTSPSGTYNVSSLPVNLTASGGGTAANLSNCMVYNTTSGASSTAALGPTFTTISGSNTFSFNSSLAVTSGTPVTLQIRCNVASSTASGSVFQFVASPTNVGSSVSGGSLMAQADFVKQLPAGLNNAIVGIITLDATKSSQPITLTSMPIAVSASNGANLSAISNCYLSNMNGMALSTGGNALTGVTGNDTLRLDTPLTIPAGQGMLLVLHCSVASSAPVGGSLTFSFAPAAFNATSNGMPVTVMQGMMSNGQPGSNSASITIASQGTSQPGSGGTPSTPGTPNTGAGGDSFMYIAMLALSALIAAFAARKALSS